MKTLKKILRKYEAEEGFYKFAKNLTLEQFFNTCEKGEWILWLFYKTNPDCIKKMSLAFGHCANTVRHLMKDERSLKSVDTTIAFAEGKVTKEELEKAWDDAKAVAHRCGSSVNWWAANAAWISYKDFYNTFWVCWCTFKAIYCFSKSIEAEKENQRLTADICRKYLPLEIWDQSKL